MSNADDRPPIPTLTDVACPGEVLRERGLWLPLNPVDALQEPPVREDWRERLPRELRDRADGMLEETRRRAHEAVDAALGHAHFPSGLHTLRRRE